jgi:aspartate ammonia-lyase
MVMENEQFRMEKDFLGTKKVPQDAYYGIQTLRGVENFPITGYKIHEELIKAIALVKKSAAIANMRLNRLTPQLGNAIIQAAEEVFSGKWHDQFILDPIQGGAGTSFNMNANEVIANHAIEILGGRRATILK